VRSADDALYDATEDLGAVNTAMTHAATALVRPDISVAQRAAHVVDLTHLSDESERIERSIPARRTNLDIAEPELPAYHSQLACCANRRD
jgi:hypothetical protein